MRALTTALLVWAFVPWCVTSWHSAARGISGKQRLCFTLPAGSIGAERDVHVFLSPGEHVREALRRACAKPRVQALCEATVAQLRPKNSTAVASATTATSAAAGRDGAATQVPPVWAAFLQHQQHLNGYHRYEVRAAVRRVTRLDERRATGHGAATAAAAGPWRRSRLRVFSPVSCEGAMVSASRAMPAPASTAQTARTAAALATARSRQSAHAEAKSALLLHGALDHQAQPGWLRLPFNLLDVTDNEQLAFYFGDVDGGSGDSVTNFDGVGDAEGPIAVLLLGGEMIRVMAANAPLTDEGIADPGIARDFARLMRQWLASGGVLVLRGVFLRDLQKLALPRALREAGFTVQQKPELLTEGDTVDLSAFKEGELEMGGVEHAAWGDFVVGKLNLQNNDKEKEAKRYSPSLSNVQE